MLSHDCRTEVEEIIKRQIEAHTQRYPHTILQHTEPSKEPQRTPRTPQPKHYDGEPCNLPVFSRHVERAKGLRFVYTGETKTSPCEKEEWLAYEGEIIWAWTDVPLPILRAIPSWTSKAGEWIWNKRTSCPGLVDEIKDDCVRLIGSGWFKHYDLEPMTPHKWEKKVGDEWTIMYETCDDIMWRSKSGVNAFPHQMHHRAFAIANSLGISIIPEDEYRRIIEANDNKWPWGKDE